ncbi:hypothetical protein [Photobacterium sp. OFAV2-7]|uniref:hypothetical protein n=1 Tax=Photobacterium sp. OFAV2-7 TaxID=2917748 RepID=UPI001EF569D5|nr:hypothetical protein [Photobacterium sp. OFAV2-7]MCG7587623.1 hypothetical protein [Photobacterium sp. OFAV2-7]
MDMNAADLNKHVQTYPDMKCSACGEMYNYVFLQSATLAFCPTSNMVELDKALLQIKQEQLQGRVDVTCKDH